MKLCTYQSDGVVQPGFQLDDGSVAPVAAGWSDGQPPRDMIELIERWDSAGGQVASSGVAGAVSTDRLDADGGWLPPVPRPSKIFGVAANNRALFEQASFAPEHPPLFAYPTSALVGHRGDILIRENYGLTHSEPELGVVIGRRAKDIGADDALDYVFGFTIVDDVTSPTMKSEDTYVFPIEAANVLGAPGKDGAPPAGFEHGDMQLTYHARSKGTDTFAPCGPWIATKDAISDPDALAVTLTIDGEVCMEDNTGNLMFSVAQVVSFASSFFTLMPGDIIHMGTAGRGKYKLRDLNYQDRIGSERQIDIAEVGTLVNTIARDPGQGSA